MPEGFPIIFAHLKKGDTGYSSRSTKKRLRALDAIEIKKRMLEGVGLTAFEAYLVLWWSCCVQRLQTSINGIREDAIPRQSRSGSRRPIRQVGASSRSGLGRD